jgi:hypothetical protein
MWPPPPLRSPLVPQEGAIARDQPTSLATKHPSEVFCGVWSLVIGAIEGAVEPFLEGYAGDVMKVPVPSNIFTSQFNRQIIHTSLD